MAEIGPEQDSESKIWRLTGVGFEVLILVVVVLTDPFRGIGAWRNSAKTQQSGHLTRSGPEVKNGRSAEDGAPERLWCGTVKEEVSHILQRVSAGAAWRIPFYSALVREQKKAVIMAAKSRQFTADKTGKSQFLGGNRRNLAGEGVVRKISSLQRVASVSNLCNSRNLRE